MNYLSCSKEELSQELTSLRAAYEEAKQKGFCINMARGVPAKEQLDLSEGLLTALKSNEDMISSGIDTRNYGTPDGMPEIKRIFAPFLAADESEILVGGGSSLNLLYDTICDGMLRGFPESEKPWKDLEKVKIICPVPGYDRHFAICAALGIEMIPVSLTKDGPNVDEIETLCADDSVKGMIAVPKYSNPDGFVYSEEIINRLASLKTAAPDFKFFWDNAYGIHDFYEYVEAPSLFEASKKVGTQNRVYTYMSTAKITYAGGGISVVAADASQIAHIKSRMNYQIICYDKVNQLRHAKFFGSSEGLLKHMTKHADLLRPKFEAVCDVLDAELAECGIAEWNRPRGGYFVSLNVFEGTAKDVHAKMKELGILMTPPGATFPHGNDPKNRNLRIAPTSLGVSDIKEAMHLLCLCAKLSAAEAILSEK